VIVASSVNVQTELRYSENLYEAAFLEYNSEYILAYIRDFWNNRKNIHCRNYMGVQHSRDAEFLKCKIIQYRLDLQTAIKLQQKSDLPYRLATSKH